MDYLEQIIKPGKLAILQAFHTIAGLEQPRKVRELKLFLCLCNVVQDVVPCFSWITVSLSKKLISYEPFQFESEACT